jgi:membrane protein DedA with SNARE-associated domain
VIDRLAGWMRIKPAHITSAERQFQRYGSGLVLAGRVIPGVRTLVSLPAGLARMNFLKFLIATLVGSYVWCTLLIGAGYLLGHEWPLISQYVKLVLPYLVFGGLLALGVYFLVGRRALAYAWARVRNNDDW